MSESEEGREGSRGVHLRRTSGRRGIRRRRGRGARDVLRLLPFAFAARHGRGQGPTPRGRVGESSRVAETRLPKRMGQVWAAKSKGHDIVGRKPIGTAYSFSFFRNIIRETAAAAMLDATRYGISASVFTASEATCLMPLFIKPTFALFHLFRSASFARHYFGKKT